MSRIHTGRIHTGRPHTGRRRNEAARQAVLDAALRLFREDPGVTVAAIAAEAGVGKQTLYRWWPTKYAILLEAFVDMGRAVVPEPDTGTLDGDLTAFLKATFAPLDDVAPLLRTLMAEAQRDPGILATLQDFTEGRRTVLRGILGRHDVTGDDAESAIDQVYGVLWYRLLLGLPTYTGDQAAALAGRLLRQLKPTR